MTYGDIEGVTAEAIRPKALCHNNPLNPLKPIVTHNYFTLKQLPQVSNNKKRVATHRRIATHSKICYLLDYQHRLSLSSLLATLNILTLKVVCDRCSDKY